MKLTHTMLAKVASAAYVGVSKLRELGFTEVIRYRKENTAAYICVHKPTRQIVVTFRGSDDWSDWKTNLDFFKIDSPFNRRVHRGFQEAYNEIRGGLEGYLRQLAGWDIKMCGHSLGAALASLCAVQSGIKFSLVATFGSPRVFGSNSEVNLANYKVIRYVNRADIVTRIPTMGYCHSGDCYFINTEGKLRMNPSGSYMKVKGFWKFWKWFKDHKIDGYVKAIEKIEAP